MPAESSPLLDFGSLRSVGHGRVAEQLGISESTFSEWLNRNVDRVAQMLTACGLKPVPVVNVCYPPDYMSSLHYFARRGMEQPPEMDDPE